MSEKTLLHSRAVMANAITQGIHMHHGVKTNKIIILAFHFYQCENVGRNLSSEKESFESYLFIEGKSLLLMIIVE